MKIITLTGASASGKDFLLKEILRENEHVKPIISITTRPKRDGEEDGVEYNFITLEEFEDVYRNDGLIEIRQYNTVDGVWYYGVTKSSIDVHSDDIYIVILDVQGVYQLREYLHTVETDKPIEMHSLFINCRGQERLARSLFREPNLSDSQVAEICRRYLDDQMQVVIYRDLFDIVLKNEGIEDVERCKNTINALINGVEEQVDCE